MSARRKAKRVLVVDDEPNVGMIFHRILGEAGYDVISASNGEEGLRALGKEQPDLVFLDLRMPGIDGMETLRRLRRTHPSLPVVIMTAYKTITSAIESMKLGAFDYLIKPLDSDRLKQYVAQALEIGEMFKKTPAVRQAPEASSIGAQDMVAEGPAMKSVLGYVERVAPTELTVLILGESGTGKEVLARLIHSKSARREKPFVVVDCAALPESLIESELFGYDKGAFTGAESDKAGKFESAQGGTLFLDEIGNLPLTVQAKLLRFLQEPTIERLGSRSGPIRLNVRMLAATNADMEQAVREGRFREDLYHRLKVFPIELPALSSRGRADLERLINTVLSAFARTLGRSLSVSPAAMDLMVGYRWPGNIRELQNALRSAAVLATGVIEPAHLPVSVQTSAPRESPAASRSPEALDDVIRRVEREHIASTVRAFKGEMASAARALGLDVNTLREKLKEHNINNF